MKYSKFLVAVFVTAMMIVGSMTITDAKVEASELATHKVVGGESLFLISRQYGITVDQLRQENNLRSDMILVGQTLNLPAGTEVGASSNSHVVTRGESLFLISRQYGITVNQLRQANNLTSDVILVGQMLTLPQGVDATRSQAVASRNVATNSYNDNDAYWLAKIIYAEAKGESYEGQVAVGAVVLNRVESSIFPNTVYGVIHEVTGGRHYQFSPVLDGAINQEPNASARRAARDAINGWDPSAGALYFYNPVTATNRWITGLPIHKQIGKHVFANPN